MTSSIPPSVTLHSASRAPDENFRDRPALPLLPLAEPNGHDTGLISDVHTALAPPHQSISVEDWDILLLAVESRLRKAVGEQLGDFPETSQLSATLSAKLVQTIVLDCVAALEQLHAALKNERGQRTNATLESEDTTVRGGN